MRDAGSCGMEEFTYAAAPRNMSTVRGKMMKEGRMITTEYMPIDDDTELVHWVNEDGEGFNYRQRWIGGLKLAPEVGTDVKVTHEEWIEQEDGLYLRIIHAWYAL